MSRTGKIAVGVLGIMLAAQVAGAAPPKVGTVYTTQGQEATDNTVAAIIVSMDLPAGRYHVSGRGTFNNYDGATADFVDCFVYAGSSGPFFDRSMASAPAAGYAALAFDGVVVIPSGGARVWVQCVNNDNTLTTAPTRWTTVRLVGTLVPNIVDLDAP